MLPLLVNVAHKKVLVVGYGKIGQRKAQQFRDQGADIWVYDEVYWGRASADIKEYEMIQAKSESDLNAKISENEDTKEVQNFGLDPLSVDNLRDFSFVLIATSDALYNQKVMTHCQGQGILCNRADSQEDNDFHTMATLWRGELGISVSTQGTVPGFAKHLKAYLGDKLPQETDQFLESLKQARQTAIELEEPEKTAQLALITDRIQEWLRGL